MMRRTIWTNICQLLLLASCSFLPVPGCDNGSTPSAPGDTYYTAISRHTVVVPESDAFYLHHIDGEEYVFYCRSDESGIRDRSFIAGTGMGGYLRRIHDVRRDGRFYHTTTSPAMLTDVFTRGWIDAAFTAGPGGPGGGMVDLSGIGLFIPDDWPETRGIGIEQGYIGFNPDIRVQIGVIEEEVREMTVTVDGPLELYTSIISDVGSGYAHDAEFESAGFSDRQVLYCGPLPVVVDIDISFIVSISAAGGFCDSCRYELRSEGTVSTGADYSTGAWSVSDGSKLVFSATSLSCSDYADGRITIDLVPRITVSFYGDPVFTMAASQVQSLTSSTGVPPDWNWAISGGPCSRITFEEGILGGGVPSFDGRGSCDTTTLRSGPYRTEDYILVASWGSEGSGEGEFLFPSGTAAGSDGSIYVCDRTANRVSRFTPDSTFIDFWGTQGTGDGQFSFPAGIASGPAGDIFVVDRGNRRIQRFDSEGNFILSFGSPGDEDGQFREPEGIAVSAGGIVYVTDNLANRVQTFTVDGIFTGSWGSTGPADGELSGPMGIALGGDGHVYVTECYNNRVQKFTLEGDPVLSWGSPGSGEGQFACPSAVCAGTDGLIYVSDYGNDRVQVFDTGGNFIATFGMTGTGEGGFDGPYGLAAGQGGEIFVTDSGNSRIQRYSPLD